MAAGDLVVQPKQFELRSFLFGAGTGYKIRRGSPAGFGQPETKTKDTDLTLQHGIYAGQDLMSARLVTFEVYVRGLSEAATMNAARLFINAFATSTTDLRLYGWLPGWGKFYVSGRPRGCDLDLGRLPFRQVEMFATFVATNPAIQFVQEG